MLNVMHRLWMKKVSEPLELFQVIDFRILIDSILVFQRYTKSNHISMDIVTYTKTRSNGWWSNTTMVNN